MEIGSHSSWTREVGPCCEGCYWRQCKCHLWFSYGSSMLILCEWMICSTFGIRIDQVVYHTFPSHVVFLTLTANKLAKHCGFLMWQFLRGFLSSSLLYSKKCSVISFSHYTVSWISLNQVTIDDGNIGNEILNAGCHAAWSSKGSRRSTYLGS